MARVIHPQHYDTGSSVTSPRPSCMLEARSMIFYEIYASIFTFINLSSLLLIDKRVKKNSTYFLLGNKTIMGKNKGFGTKETCHPSYQLLSYRHQELWEFLVLPNGQLATKTCPDISHWKIKMPYMPSLLTVMKSRGQYLKCS